MKGVVFLVLLAGCGSSSSKAVDAGPPTDATASDTSQADAPPLDGPIVAPCGVRPACQACLADAGVCCVSPNPSPPPEYATACAACPGDAGPASITLGCVNETGCAGSQVCCIQKDASGNVSSFCAASCNTSRQAQLCDANAASTACPSASPCSRASIDAWNLPHCFGTCGGAPPPP